MGCHKTGDNGIVYQEIRHNGVDVRKGRDRWEDPAAHQEVGRHKRQVGGGLSDVEPTAKVNVGLGPLGVIRCK